MGDTENNETAETDLNVIQTNAATMQSGKQNVKDTAQVTCQNKFFDKVNRTPDSSSAAYDPAENTFWWALYLNCYDNNGTLTTVGRKLTDVTVTDKLPDGTSLVDWTLYQVNGESLSQVTDPEILKTVTLTENSGELTFHFGNLLSEGQAYVLYLQVHVDPRQNVGKNTFKNDAYLNAKEGSEYTVHTYATSTQTITASVLEKNGEQMTASDNTYIYKAKWTLDVNKNGMANGFIEPTLTDQLPEGASFTDVEIYQYKDYTDTKGNDISDDLKENWAYDPETRTFTFKLPVITGESEQPDYPRYHAYQVVIYADIAPSEAGTKMDNTAAFKAHDTTIGEDNTTVNVFYFGVTVGATFTSRPPSGDLEPISITIQKTSEEGLALSDAVFTVAYSTDSGGTYTSYGETEFVTDEQGQFTITNLPHNTTHVQLTETKPPFGYAGTDSDGSPLVYTLTKESDGGWTVASTGGGSGTANGDTITLTNTPQTYAVSFEKRGYGEAALADVTFALSTSPTKPTNTDGLPEGTTETNGRVTITGLTAGMTYYVYETASTDNTYLLPEDYVMVVKVDADGNVTCYEADGTTLWSKLVNNVAPVITNEKGVAVTIDGTKTLKGRALAAGEFTFVLAETTEGVADEDKVRMTATNAADGSFSFTLRYDAADEGEHTYTISEEAGTLSRVTYDKTVYNLKVTVTVDEQTGDVTAASILTKQGETDSVTSANFTNTYTSGGGGHTPRPTPTPTPSDEPDPTPKPTPSDDGEIDIPEESTPLDDHPDLPEDPDNPPPVDPDDPPETFDIPDDDIPLDDLPDLPVEPGDPSPDGPDDPPEEFDIPEDDIPLGDLPQTGMVAAPVNPTTTLGLIALAAALITGGMGLTYARRKDEEE